MKMSKRQAAGAGIVALVSAAGVAVVGAGGAVASVSANAVQQPGQTARPSTNFLPPTRKGRAPASVKIGLSGGYQVNYLPTEVAMGAGYFKQVAKRFHTTITFDPYVAGSAAEAGFVGGVDQFGVIGLSSSLPSEVGGRDQVSVFGQGVDLAIEMVGGLKDRANGTDIARFGPPASWCEIGAAGSSNTAARLEAAKNGLNLAQLKLTNIGTTSATLPTLQSGQCDITSAAVTDAGNGLINGGLYVAANLATPEASVPIAGEVAGTPLQTSMAFARQYPQLTQAIIDAELESLHFIQAHLNNSGAIYRVLPAAMKAILPVGAFAEALTLVGPGFKSNVYSGEFSADQVNDSITLFKALGTVASTGIDPTMVFSNKYVAQAYQDLGLPAPTGATAGGAVRHTLGKPSAESASAYALLTGQPAPASSGPSPLSKIKS
jgi:ABC-type nitrate/sulfonate/bicarbonate transport system substrate-binding protein